MKMEDYRKDNFNVLNLMGADKKALTIETLSYISRLAAITHTETKDWDITEIFSSGEAKMLLIDRSQINQRFFEKKATESPKNPVEDVQLPDVVHLAMLKAKQAQAAKLNAPLLKDIQYNQDEIHNYIRAMNTKSKAIADTRHKILENEEKQTIDLSYQIKKIIHDGFWDFWDMSADYVDFVNRNTLRILYKNEKLGIDYNMDLGFFRVRLSFKDFSLIVHPHQNNHITSLSALVYAGMMHPHVYEKQSVCFGSAGDIAVKLKSNGLIADLFQLLGQIMSQYNPDSPTVTLAELEKAPILNHIAPERPVFLKAGEEWYWECECGSECQDPVIYGADHCSVMIHDGEEIDEDHEAYGEGDYVSKPRKIFKKIRSQAPVMQQDLIDGLSTNGLTPRFVRISDPERIMFR